MSFTRFCSSSSSCARVRRRARRCCCVLRVCLLSASACACSCAPASAPAHTRLTASSALPLRGRHLLANTHTFTLEAVPHARAPAAQNVVFHPLPHALARARARGGASPASSARHHTGTVVFLPGLGGTANDFREFFEELLLLYAASMRTARVLVLDAPYRAVTVLRGEPREEVRAWLDVHASDPATNRRLEAESAEAAAGMREAADTLVRVLRAEAARLGGDLARVVLGGFSQGGVLATYVAAAHLPAALAGLVSCSAYTSPLLRAEHLQPAAAQTPLLIAHGVRDTAAPWEGPGMARESYAPLLAHMPKHEVVVHQAAGHVLAPRTAVMRWIAARMRETAARPSW